MKLRDVLDSDLPTLFKYQQDAEASKMAAVATRDWDAFMNHWGTKILSDASVGRKTIVVDDNVVGHLVSWNENGKRLLGYWLGRDFWGRGIATAALSDYLKVDPHRPLHAYAAVHNLGSIRVLEKCGFRRIGAQAIGTGGVEEFLFGLDA